MSTLESSSQEALTPQPGVDRRAFLSSLGGLVVALITAGCRSELEIPFSGEGERPLPMERVRFQSPLKTPGKPTISGEQLLIPNISLTPIPEDPRKAEVRADIVRYNLDGSRVHEDTLSRLTQPTTVQEAVLAGRKGLIIEDTCDRYVFYDLQTGQLRLLLQIDQNTPLHMTHEGVNYMTSGLTSTTFVEDRFLVGRGWIEADGRQGVYAVIAVDVYTGNSKILETLPTTDDYENDLSNKVADFGKRIIVDLGNGHIALLTQQRGAHYVLKKIGISGMLRNNPPPDFADVPPTQPNIVWRNTRLTNGGATIYEAMARLSHAHELFCDDQYVYVLQAKPTPTENGNFQTHWEIIIHDKDSLQPLGRVSIPSSAPWLSVATGNGEMVIIEGTLPNQGKENASSSFLRLSLEDLRQQIK